MEKRLQILETQTSYDAQVPNAMVSPNLTKLFHINSPSPGYVLGGRGINVLVKTKYGMVEEES